MHLMVCLNGCINLTSVPEQLFPHVTTSKESVGDSTCKNMFKGCTNLKTLSPEFLHKKGSIDRVYPNGYYGMFENCSSLSSIPYESLNTLTYCKNGYALANMFKNCTFLTDISGLKFKIKHANDWDPQYAYSSMFERMYQFKQDEFF